MVGQGRLDIFKTHFADDTPILYRNRGKGLFEDITGRAGLGCLYRFVGWGAGFADFDNDGLPDLFFVTEPYPEIEKLFDEYKYRNPTHTAAQSGQWEAGELQREQRTGSLRSALQPRLRIRRLRQRR